jgi:hypothetical protein
VAVFEELGEWSERDSSSSSSSQSWKGSKIVAHNVDMPLSMISSSSFGSCNLLRGIPQRPQKMMMIPGWWRVILESQHVVPKGCKVSPLQSSSHSCWAAKKAGYQHGKEEEDEEVAAAEETLAGYFVKS